ncbi:MAG: ATP-dependent Clp protease adapter ClpS [Oscillatoriales cyanobacterium SM2_2_1]|nr:ATP-dependent Clp protease adapter ClpS [Oscillatoriales cyanobacterium SM2_2_1]
MSTQTIERPVTGSSAKIAPRYRVLLHNDDYNTMEHVVQSLMQVVNGLTQPQAVDIMMEAHSAGVALVITCVQEHAEFYCDGLKSKGLTSTIEPDE